MGMLFGFPNRADAGALSGGSWEAALPLTNLQDTRVQKVARSTDDATASTQFALDLTTDKAIRLISLHGHNLSLAALVRARVEPLVTFVRASNSRYRDSEGTVVTSGGSTLRSFHHEYDENGVLARCTLLEKGSTNLVIRSESFSVDWSAIGTPTISAAEHTSAGVNLDLIGDNDAAAAEGYSIVPTFTGNAVKAISVFMKEGATPPAGGSEIILRDTTAAADRLQATVTWVSGVPSVVMTTGTLVRSELWRDGVYRLEFATTSVTAANTNQLEIYPGRKGTVADTGDVRIGGVQAEDQLRPTSYQRTTGATATRDADVLYRTFTPAPQEMTVLVKLHGYRTQASQRILHFGAASPAGTAARLTLLINSSGNILLEHEPDSGTSSTTAHTPSVAATLEIRCVLQSDGDTLMGVSEDGGAEALYNGDGAQALDAAWADTRMYLNSEGTSNHGENALEVVKVVKGVKTIEEMRLVQAGDVGVLEYWEAFDSGFDAAYPNIYPTGAMLWGEEVTGALDADALADGYPSDVIIVLPRQVLGKDVTVEIDDTANVDTYVEVGRLIVAPGYEPSINFVAGAALGYQTSSSTLETDGGAFHHDERPRRRTFEFALESIDSDEALVQLFEMNRRMGTHAQFLFVYDDDDTVHLGRRSFLATLQELSPLAIPYATFHDAPFQLVEEL